MNKPWSEESVYIAHNYNNIKADSLHNNFKNFIQSYIKEKPSILDIGGGNGRAYLTLKDTIKSYTCIDLNRSNIESAKEFFKLDSAAEFIYGDIELISLEDYYDIIYIDSVLTMLEKPFDLLLMLSKNTDFIFVNRTRFTDTTKKGQHTWSGMSQPSTYWTFDIDTMTDFCIKNNLKLWIIDEVAFVIYEVRD